MLVPKEHPGGSAWPIAFRDFPPELTDRTRLPGSSPAPAWALSKLLLTHPKS